MSLAEFCIPAAVPSAAGTDVSAKSVEHSGGSVIDEPQMAKLMDDLLHKVEQGGKRAIKALLEDARMISCEHGIGYVAVSAGHDP